MYEEYGLINESLASMKTNDLEYRVSNNITVSMGVEIISFNDRAFTTSILKNTHNNLFWRQNWYRSSGSNDPNKSPLGTWLPFRKFSISLDWIEKYFFQPIDYTTNDIKYSSGWIIHDKSLNEFILELQEISKILTLIEKEVEWKTPYEATSLQEKQPCSPELLIAYFRESKSIIQ